MPNLAEKITEVRKQNNLTQEELAEMLDVSRQAVSKWESGQSTPRDKLVSKMCKELHIPKSELLGDKYSCSLINYEKKKQFFIKLIIITFITLLLLLSLLYRVYALYKYCILTEVTNRVLQYEYLDNYYCRVDEYLNDKMKSKTEIWYKDGVYKIKGYNYNSAEEQKSETLKWINCHTGIRTQYNIEDKKFEEYKEYVEEDNKDLIEQTYYNGKYMYTFFPITLRYSSKQIKKLSLELNSISLEKKENALYFEKDNSETILNSQFLPICYKTEMVNDVNMKQYIIVLDEVSEDDITIKI